MDEFRVEVKPVAFICRGYIEKEGGIHKSVTVALVPFRVSREKNNIILIGWACNYGDTCHNEKCRYSIAWKKRKSLESLSHSVEVKI